MKEYHYNMVMSGETPPEMFVFAHYHHHQHEQIEIGGKTIGGYLLPSWKLIDAYVSRINPFAFSNIGCMISVCTKSGIASKFETIHIEQSGVSAL
jgi:hypothetical protein